MAYTISIPPGYFDYWPGKKKGTGSSVSNAFPSGATLIYPTGFSVEHFVRPVVKIDSFLRERLPPVQEEPVPEAQVTWGDAASFVWSSTQGDTGGGDTVVVDPPSIVVSPGSGGGGGVDDDDGGGGGGGTNDPVPQPPPSSTTILFDETQREVEEVRVENPDDSAQYVIVERITAITFRGPNTGRFGEVETLWKFTLHHPED